jgi:hypothetical protein
MPGASKVTPLNDISDDIVAAVIKVVTSRENVGVEGV